MFIGGIFLSYFLSKQTRIIKKVSYVIWIVPLAIYFAFHPIYEGDFSNKYRKIVVHNKLLNSNSNQLVVITIPGCPFCKQSIQTIKKIKKRCPKLKVTYIICSSDSSSIDWYKSDIKNSFSISLVKNTLYWSKIAQGKFPSFLLVTKNQSIIWSNENFGTLAKDAIEHKFEFIN